MLKGECRGVSAIPHTVVAFNPRLGTTALVKEALLLTHLLSMLYIYYVPLQSI